MYGIKGETRRMRVKGQGDLYGGYVDLSKWQDGQCLCCSRYDVELIEICGYHYCRYEDCIALREHIDMLAGRIMRGADGQKIVLRMPELAEQMVEDYEKGFEYFNRTGKLPLSIKQIRKVKL